jgi:hypothetical protein
MNVYRLRIDEIKEDAVTSYTRWLEAVIVKGTENQRGLRDVSVRFSNASGWNRRNGCRSMLRKNRGILGYAPNILIRLYSWAKKYASVGKKRVSLPELRKVLGLETVTDAEGSVIQESPLPIWANFRQRALDPPILEINKKTDLKIELQSLERAKHRRVTFLTLSIEEQAVQEGD